MIGDDESPSAGSLSRIEALGYRSLRFIDQPVSPFHVLVGPNASGKSTFLDVVAFLGDLIRVGLEGAVQGDPRFAIAERAPDAKHLVWMREGDRFELAVEVEIPQRRRARVKNGKAEICRYEIAVDVTGPLRLVTETLWLKPKGRAAPPREPDFFPQLVPAPQSIVRQSGSRTPKGWKKVLARGKEPERVIFMSETSGWNNPFRLPADKAALTSLPADEERFPVATWFREMLLDGVQRIVLSSEAMRRPSAPGRPRGYLPDGSNLPWVVHGLERRHPERIAEWARHLHEALPDLEKVGTRVREEDRHCYLVLKYANGLEAPSWLVSDGTLRLLALTLLAYLPDATGVYLVEEPENGIHPRAVETLYQSLSSVYGAQVLMATHSPVILSMAKPRQLLCFSRSREGATDIVRGSEHPALKKWRAAADLGTLFASGILG